MFYLHLPCSRKGSNNGGGSKKSSKKGDTFSLDLPSDSSRAKLEMELRQMEAMAAAVAAHINAKTNLQNHCANIIRRFWRKYRSETLAGLIKRLVDMKFTTKDILEMG